jgi:uncharacterized OB-fold protein
VSNGDIFPVGAPADVQGDGWARRPRPRPTPFTEPFWQATAQRRLVVQRCEACGRWRWPPQLACPECLSESATWDDTSGTGTLYSYSVVHRGVDRARFPGTYVLAIVELDEGVHLLTNLVDCNPSALAIGARVHVVYQPLDDDFTVYPFTVTDA